MGRGQRSRAWDPIPRDRVEGGRLSPAWGSGIAGESLDGIPFYYIDLISSDGGFGVEPVEGRQDLESIALNREERNSIKGFP